MKSFQTGFCIKSLCSLAGANINFGIKKRSLFFGIESYRLNIPLKSW